MCRLCAKQERRTLEIRGILCSRCNLGLGQFDDDPARLRAAAAYLDQQGQPLENAAAPDPSTVR